MPSVKRLVFKVASDPTTRAAMLKRGEVDIAYMLDAPKAGEYHPSHLILCGVTGLIPKGGTQMKTLIVVSALALSLLGLMTAPAAAQQSGLFCLRIVEPEEVAQFFALATGGGQVILTGENITFRRCVQRRRVPDGK